PNLCITSARVSAGAAAIQTSQAFSIRAESHLSDIARPTSEHQGLLDGFGFPHLHSAVVRSAGQTFAIWAEGHAPNCSGVPSEREEFVTGLDVPYLRREILGAAGQS